MKKNMQSGHALDMRIARDYLRTYPAHVAGLIANADTEHADLYDTCIRNSVSRLVQSARLIYPKRMAA